jgi:DNA-binding transcriptional regulator YiaG
MGRPLKDGLAYFQHDVGMSNDEKIEALEAVHGNDGYAVFNKLLERIFKSFGKLDLSDDVQRLSIARKCNVSSEKFEQIIIDAVRFRLFDEESWTTEKRLTSCRIKQQLEVVEEERERWRKKAGGENPAQAYLSPEKTPLIPGENPSYPLGKVHKAEQSRAEQNRKEQQAARETFPQEAQDQEALHDFALAKAKTSKGVKNLEAYARTLMAKPNIIAEYEQSRSRPPEPAKAQSPSNCTCGANLKRTTEAAVCPSCGKGWEYNPEWNTWDESDEGWNDIKTVLAQAMPRSASP